MDEEKKKHKQPLMHNTKYSNLMSTRTHWKERRRGWRSFCSPVSKWCYSFFLLLQSWFNTRLPHFLRSIFHSLHTPYDVRLVLFFFSKFYHLNHSCLQFFLHLLHWKAITQKYSIKTQRNRITEQILRRIRLNHGLYSRKYGKLQQMIPIPYQHVSEAIDVTLHTSLYMVGKIGQNVQRIF